MFDKNIGLDTNWIKSSDFKLQINDYSLIHFQDTEDRSSVYHMKLKKFVFADDIKH